MTRQPIGAETVASGAASRLLQRAIDVRPDEVWALAWSWLYIFCVLSAYYIIRPIRDDMGVASGVETLPWLFTGTLLGMMLVNPPFAALVARLPRVRFISLAYRFFMANLLLFFLLLQVATPAQNIWVGRIFFIWTSVFNLFVVSVFWSFMADLFTPTQGARLFGVIAAGGSTGAMVGPLLTTALTYMVPVPLLMVVSAGFLAVCGLCIARLDSWSRHRTLLQSGAQGEPIGGSMWAGIRLALRSPYLLGICLYLFLLTTSATFLYLEQTRLVGEQIQSPEGRTRLFALIDLVVNVVTFITQVFITSQMISKAQAAACMIFAFRM